jgi:hypothetical protein
MRPPTHYRLWAFRSRIGLRHVSPWRGTGIFGALSCGPVGANSGSVNAWSRLAERMCDFVGAEPGGLQMTERDGWQAGGLGLADAIRLLRGGPLVARAADWSLEIQLPLQSVACAGRGARISIRHPAGVSPRLSTLARCTARQHLAPSPSRQRMTGGLRLRWSRSARTPRRDSGAA